MKKIFTTGLLASSMFAFCQTSDSAENGLAKNEITLNAVYPFFGASELSYERHLLKHSSVGLSTTFGFSDLDLSFGFTPYYRYYLGKKPNAGFFLEANSALVWDKPHNVYDANYNLVGKEKNFGIGVGAAVGYKLMLKNNFLIEAYGGAGKFLNNKISDGAYPRFGISVGKRF